jgi:serine/threonine protein kinase/DNA-binding beta-propeller fold protein YncE
MATDFGNYEVLSELGRGGMGIVYQALDRRNQRMVAIKQLVLENIDPKKQREFEDRFKREAQMASRLNHPNIVTVFDVEADSHYYVMEYLDGHSLRKELDLRGGRVTAKELWPILKQVADGLAYAHSFNVVHRDVKPDNIFILKDGTVKITDFGIARTVDYEQTHLTKTGVMLGTLAYVSPEQLQDAKNVDHRADIFSLGVVCYEALSGKLPFTGDGIAGTVIKILTSEAEPLASLNPSVSVEIGAVVTRSIRKKARDRFMSVLDFAREFERALSTSPAQPASAASEPDRAVKVATSSAAVYTPGIPIEIKPKGASTNLPEREKTPFELKEANRENKTVASQDVTAFYLVRPLASIGRKGEGNGCFIEPSVVCARNGKIVVADTALRRVQIFARDGRFLAAIATKKDARDSRTDGGSLTKPSGLALDFRGRIYVCDSSDHYVRVFDATGTFLKEIFNLHGRDGGIQGLVCDSTGLLYLADPDNGCLQVFQSDLGTWLRAVGSKGPNPGQFQLPSGLAVDRFNQIYAVDYSASKVSVFTKAGAFLRSFGGKGTANGFFNVPRGIAVDKFDRIYVADSLNHRIQVFGPAGEWIYTFGGRGHEQGKFISPSGLSIDPDNNCLYVVDRGNQRIQVFELVFA